MKRYFLIFITYGILLGCVKTLDIPAPAYVKKVVVTGILSPNDSLTVSLQYNLKADAKDSLYPIITNATVTFYENNVLLGEAKNYNNGLYRLNYSPKEGRKYKVMISVPDYGELEAEETLPISKEMTVVTSENKGNNPNNNPNFTATFRSAEAKANYWLSLYQDDYSSKWNDPNCSKYSGRPVPPSCKFIYYLSAAFNRFATNSYLSDRFNAEYDPLTGFYTYSRFMRIDNSKIKNQEVIIDFTASNPLPKSAKNNESVYLRLLITGTGFDQYLKSAIAANFNKPADAYGNIGNPFAEPIPIYSNIKNGIGVFGAVIEKQVKIQL